MAGDGIGLNLTYHQPPPPPVTPVTPVTPAAVMNESHNVDIPSFLTGIILPHVICTLFIFARIASRLWVMRKWFIDDTLVILSWLFTTALCVVYSITATTPSLLTAPDDATLQGDANPYIMRTYLGLIYYQLSLCLAKLSIVAFYLRVFASRPRERWAAWGTAAFVLLYGAPMLLMSILQCHPAPGLFFGKPMTCFRFPELLISSASLHSATDAWLIAMVVPCVARLDLPRRQKVALAVVLSLGVLVIAASMVRLQLSLHRHFRPGSAGVANTLAFFVLTVLECDLALICASAPTLRPLLARVFPAFAAAAKRRSIESTRDESFDLTSLTYHGYPWTEPTTPLARSKNPSIASHLNRLRMPAPPVPMLSMSHRAPTTLSLRSAVLGVAARTKVRQPAAGDGRPMLAGIWDPRRTSSIYSTDPPFGELADEKTRMSDDAIPKTMRLSLGHESRATGNGTREPASPNRLSPMSGLSGETYAIEYSVDTNSSSSAKGEKDGRLTIHVEIPKGKKGAPPRPKRPDES